MTPSPGSPAATVVITTHDRPDEVQRAVRSALAQTLPAVEVIVVDDGSAQAFVDASCDARVRVVRRETSGGMCAARNDGLAQARGEWVTFLDDDDELAPEMLERSIAAAAGSSLPAPVAVMASMVIVGPDGAELDRCVPPTLRRGEHFMLEGRGDLRAKNALVIPTELARAIGGWDPQFEAFEADDFGIRLNHEASILGLDEPLYRMTHHTAPRLTRRREAIPRDMERTVDKHPEEFAQHRVTSAHYLSTIGMYHLQAGHWGPAVSWTFRGVARDPARPRGWLFFGAALAGPAARDAYRRVRAKDSGVPAATLMRRRLRKYWYRALAYPRSWIATPVAAATRLVERRRRPVVAGAPAVLVLCVYRRRNAARVDALVRATRSDGWCVRLWALDELAPELADDTVGTSTGPKFPLLNELLRGVDLGRFDWVVVADDDFVLPHGSIADVLAVAEAADLDLVQPAHVDLSYFDHDIARRRAASIARLTTFVEIGPMFAIRRPWTTRLLPVDARHVMGWGLELEWSDLREQGLRLGVVDVMPLRHVHPPGKAYAHREEDERLGVLLRERGLDELADGQRTLGTWRPWRVHPPWSRREPSSPRPSDEGISR